MSSLPPFVVRAASVPEIEGRYPPPFDGELLSLGRDLGRAAGSRAVGLWQERLPPGHRTSFTHAHLREEELVYVLSGSPSLRWVPPGQAAEEAPLQPGDTIAFPAGTGIAHTFVNRSTEDAVLLVFGERKGGERAWYPEDREYMAHRAYHRPLCSWTDVLGPDGTARPPAYRIETPRLVLRPWGPADAADLTAIVARERDHLLPWMPWADSPPDLDGYLAICRRFQVHFASDEDYVYGVFDLEGRPIGGTGYHLRIGLRAVEIGYWICKDRQGQGLVTEWVAALTRLALEVLGHDRVEIHCDPENVRSAAIPRRLGFRHEATLPRRTAGLGDRLSDAMIWTMYASDLSDGPVSDAPVRAWDGAGRRLL